MIQPTPDTRLFDYPRYRASLKPAPFLPMSQKEMRQLGWDSCDVVLVTGDAYVDHPSFGMAVIGRMLEAQGFRVGIIAQPDWQSKQDFMRLGKPNLCFGVTAGNMDSMVNRYTAERRLRHDDAYTPGDEGGKRPDRATLVYTQRCKEAWKDVPVILGGIEASLRRIAHYDYWSDKVRRSVLLDAKADLLIFGNAERPLVEIMHRLAAGEPLEQLRDIRGSSVLLKQALPGWSGIDSTRIDQPGKIDAVPNPYGAEQSCQKFPEQPLGIETGAASEQAQAVTVLPAGSDKTAREQKKMPWQESYVLLPAYEKVCKDKVLYAHASRVLHTETNPFSARALAQFHAERLVWINPPALPLSTVEMDGVFGLPFARRPHPAYGKAKIPAYEMIKTSVNIMRGCFGGCSFCSITEHEGRVIQSRSQDSVLKEIEQIRDSVPGFTGVISDLGGPTANMYHLKCKSPRAEMTCRRLSCIYPEICPHMETDHSPTIDLYRAARKLPGIKKILIASGVRYDLAIEDPRYVKELVQHHVGGYLKIAPEHTEQGPLSKMMKPGMGSYHRFKELFDKYSAEAGKKQYLIPYFISAHPGTSDLDMVNLALWLKQNRFKLDQVQNFYPTPLANASAIYHTRKNSLRKVSYKSEDVEVPFGGRQRRLHKALLRYHDEAGWPIIREALEKLGLKNLIGHSANCLVPPGGRGGSPRQQGDSGRNSGRSNDARPGQRAQTRFTRENRQSDSHQSPSRRKPGQKSGQKAGQQAGQQAGQSSHRSGGNRQRTRQPAAPGSGRGR